MQFLMPQASIYQISHWLRVFVESPASVSARGVGIVCLQLTSSFVSVGCLAAYDRAQLRMSELKLSPAS